MAESKTPNLDLLVVEPNDFYNYKKQQKDNFEKIDASFGAKLSTLLTAAKTLIGSINELFTNKLDKGTGLKATNARQLEQKIENLSYKEELVLLKEKNTSGTMTFPHAQLDDYTEILVTGAGIAADERFSTRRDIHVFKQNLPNFRINIMDNEQPNYGDYARMTTDGVTVTIQDITGVVIRKIYGIRKTIG